MKRAVLVILVTASAMIFLAPGRVHAQATPLLWMVHEVEYPNGDPVPAANLSFRGWLRKTDDVPVNEYVFENSAGSGVGDSDPQIYLECSLFGEYNDPTTWWDPGDTLYCMLIAANDPVTSETDSTLVWDLLEYIVGQPYMYYDDFTVPIPVELMSFAADRQGSDVVLSWTVARELDNLGFFIQRSTSEDGFYTRISELIPGQGTSNQEATYSWTDSSPEGPVVFYMLEDVDYQGLSTVHGPLRVVVGGDTSWGAIKAAFAE